MITVTWFKHISAQVVRIMLDYTDHVSFCTKLKDTLMEQKQWQEICEIQSKTGTMQILYPLVVMTFITKLTFYLTTGNARSLKHLCRLRIRDHFSHLRMRASVFINFLPLPPRLKDYLRYKEFDVYSRGSMMNLY